MTMQANALQVANSLSTQVNKNWTKRLVLWGVLVTIDTVMVLLGFWLAYYLRFEVDLHLFYQHEASLHTFYQQFVFFMVPLWIIIFGLFGLYNFKNLFSGTREYALIFNAATFGIMTVILATFFDPDLDLARGWVLIAWLAVMGTVGVSRFAFRRAVHRMRSKGRFMTKVIIVGTNEEGHAIAHQLQSSPNSGIKITGFVSTNVAKSDIEPRTGLPLLGTVDDITKVAQTSGAEEIIIVSTALTRRQLLTLVETLHEADLTSRLSSGLYEMLTTGVEVQTLGNVPLMTINKVRLTGAELVMKRTLDFVGAIAALILFSPVMAAIGLAVKFDSSGPGPIFYRRRVVGVGGREFDAFKFRTMSIDADSQLAKNAALRKQFEQNYKLKDDPRVTRVGKFLRRTSLDELPQLFNVLLGQMSLVGPRMITSPERSYYGKWSTNLFTVKPGMTGLWQVSGRSEVSYAERVRLDMQYIRNYSIWTDVYLLWMTIPAVLKSRGAY